jgi:protein TonB
MAPLSRESEIAGQTNVAGPVPGGGAKPQPLAVEIPITVNGARTVTGGDKREPFSESTQTVLVFGSGAVIRLSAAVGPGQLLFVTNEKSQKEVVCQVVKSKQNGGGGGYVELKFTEAASDFWGVRLPSVMPPPAGPVVPAVATPSTPSKATEEKPTDGKSAAPGLTVEPLSPPKTAERVPALTIAPSPAVISTPRVTVPISEHKRAPVVPMPSHATLASVPSPTQIPTLSEFLTQGANGLELTKDRSSSTKSEVREEPVKEFKAELTLSPVAVTPPTTKLRENAPGLAAALGIRQNAAPGALSFDLAAEEVKIPAWLEPLARNSSADNKIAEVNPEASNAIPEVELSEASSASAAQPVNQEARHESQLLTSEGRAPNFGSSLALGAQGESKGSGKSWKVIAAIVVLALAAAAVWYWYVNQPPKVSASNNRDAAGNGLESIPTPAPDPVAAPPVKPATSVAPDAAYQPTEISAAVSSPAAVNRPVSPAAKQPAMENMVDEPAKRPTLGPVHLAAPKVSRRASSQENSAADPGVLVGNGASSDANNATLLAGKSKGPAAPVVIGGDVQPAQLLSSVPPVYPQLARSQRISGDVTVDLLVDARGLVSATRVISGSPLLHQAAVEAVKQWKYKPAMLNGQPTSMHLTVTVQFRLQ